MTNVSRSKIKTDEFALLHKELVAFMGKLNTKSAQYFFGELFTESEQIMIIKRFSAIILFHRGYSSYKVWNMLHISPTTAQKLLLSYESGRYKNLVHNCTAKEIPTFFVFIEKLIRAQGKERWLFLN